MMQLANYVCGEWVRAQGGWRGLVHPATEERLAEASTEGIDIARAVAFARQQGGPALRALTFRERAELLRALSRSVHARRDELLGLAIANGGNTRSDAKFDVDGAIGTLAAYADLGEELGQEVGDRRWLLDGEGVKLGRGARLFGQHVLSPRPGVAVHVNAYNFPAWGLCEKAACALLAGVPVVAKPATSTAIVAHRIVEAAVEDGVLPVGALSLLCGPTPALVDALGADDVLAFTGSSDTAARLRAGRPFTFASAHANVEADSLNAAILGPDVEVGSDLGALFVGDVIRDMTQKAGQKCTAIRRIAVPSSRVSAVVEALADRLGAVRVGHPALEDVTMGPLVTAEQLREVMSGIAELVQSAEGAAIVLGGVRPGHVVGVDGPAGFFLAPTLIRASEARPNGAVHRREVFGPVATVVPYDGSPGLAVELVRWGGGALVTSVYSDDVGFLREVLAGALPFQGRVVLGSSKAASQAIPPGTVLPVLVHGGPGRAGGGEELGGRRGLALYLQRTALQGDRALIERLLSTSNSRLST